MKVTMRYAKTGKEQKMHPRYAKVLASLGRAQYVTRDMVAASPGSIGPVEEKIAPDAHSEAAGHGLSEELHASLKMKTAKGLGRKSAGAAEQGKD